MSLCGIWRDPVDDLFLFSDSRILLNDKHSDAGIKIISVPVKVTDPANLDKLIYPWNIALCFAGDCLSAYITVLSLSQLLPSLEIDLIQGRMSFEALADIIRRGYQKIAQEEFGIIKQSELPDIIIAGVVP